MDLSLIRELALVAGAIGMKYFGHARKSYKPDRTIVTEADLEIEAFLLDSLRRRYPEHGFVAEESCADSTKDSPYTWAIDPVDGTHVFARGFPFWAVSIGLLKDGKPHLGVIFQPALNDLYAGEPGSVSLNGEPIGVTADTQFDEHAYLMVPESSHRRFRCDWEGGTLSLGSVAAHCAYVARGCAAGTISKPFIWDLAAGAAIMEPLGIISRYLDGTEIEWPELFDGRRVPQPVLGARESYWRKLAECIKLGR
jgi:myo-inositol-1(or 4)-monophosphatase